MAVFPDVSSRFGICRWMTVAEYIRTQKLNEAKRLLTETDYSLSEIALHLVYSSQSYFQNQFKSEFGITPTQYKTAD